MSTVEPKWMSAPTLPELQESTGTHKGRGWEVTVYDNNVNTYEEVMSVLMLATGCDSQEAYIEAWEIDHYGKCVVHQASKEECQKAAGIICTIGIRVEVGPSD